MTGERKAATCQDCGWPFVGPWGAIPGYCVSPECQLGTYIVPMDPASLNDCEACQ